jgi:hypothetical protein
MKCEDGSAAGFGFQQIREARLEAGALVAEGERTARGRNVIRQAFAVLGGLDLDGGERDSGFLGFDDSDGGAIYVEQVVCEAVALLEGILADGNTPRRRSNPPFRAAGPTIQQQRAVCQFRCALPVREPFISVKRKSHDIRCEFGVRCEI